MPEKPSEAEIQRLAATQPGMFGRARTLLTAYRRGEMSARDVSFQLTEIKLQADENLETMKKLHATRNPKNEDEK